MQSSHTILRELHAANEEEGEGLMLVVQYVRESNIPASELTTSIIDEWRQLSASHAHSLSTKAWSDIHRLHYRPQDNTCAEPPSANIEHDAYASRIVDLSYFLRNQQCLYSLVSALSSHDYAISVSIQGRPVLLNYDAKGVAQSGVAGWNSFHDKGITGENQIVGIADSGLNDYSCFFYDNSLYYSKDYTTRTGIYSSSVERYRRKVIQYVSYADSSDVVAGHGTHVAGTIVGQSIFDGYSGGNGVAPDAKIAFYDVQSGSSPYLSIPDLNMFVLKTQYNAGARVMSHSWGSNTEGLYILHCSL